jgi:hypothetical protein
MGRQVIFDGSHLRAVLFPGHARLLMVTLDWRRDGKDQFSPDVYATHFARAGIAQLSIKTQVNDWFINPDTVALEQALTTLPPFYTRVQMLGFSMGAYGALRFAKALHASTVVAVSPQWSIHPDHAPFEQRYSTEGRSLDPGLADLGPRAVPGLRGLILIDPFVPADLLHARRIQAAFPALQMLRLSFGGHPAFGVIREAGASWAVYHAASARRPDPAAILAAHRAGRRRSAAYWLRLAEQAGPRHPRLALRAADHARALGPGRQAEQTPRLRQMGVDGAGESP